MAMPNVTAAPGGAAFFDFCGGRLHLSADAYNCKNGFYAICNYRDRAGGNLPKYGLPARIMVAVWSSCKWCLTSYFAEMLEAFFGYAAFRDTVFGGNS